MNELVSIYAGKELHVVLDNLNTHKPKDDRLLKAHPHVHLHFIPTHSSWLNQVECWFSILSRSALEGRSFTSVRMLIQAIGAFIGRWNQHAAPFEWTKKEVDQQQMKRSYAYLCNFALVTSLRPLGRGSRVVTADARDLLQRSQESLRMLLRVLTRRAPHPTEKIDIPST